MLSQSEMMILEAQTELGKDAENLLEKFATFEKRFPDAYEDLRENIQEEVDFDLDDLTNLLQIFSEITGYRKS